MMERHVLLLILLLPFISACSTNYHTPNHTKLFEHFGRYSNRDQRQSIEFVVSYMINSFEKKAIDIIKSSEHRELITLFELTLVYGDCGKTERKGYKNDYVFVHLSEESKQLALKYREGRKFHGTIKQVEKTCVADVALWCKLNPNSIFKMKQRDLESHHTMLYVKIVCPFNSDTSDDDYYAIKSTIDPLKKPVMKPTKKYKKPPQARDFWNLMASFF